MYKWIIAGIIGLSLIASFAVIKYGLRAKAVPIIKPSNFEKPEMLGMYITRQLYQKLKTSSPIIFGYDKTSPYEVAVVGSLVSFLNANHPVIEVNHVTMDESLKNSCGDGCLAFSFISLKNVEEASDIEDCERDHTYSIWLECTKRQKLRSINHARKINLDKPAAIVETHSTKDILIFVRE